MQSRVADTALTYQRAQEALEQDRPVEQMKADNTEKSTRESSHVKVEETEATKSTYKGKITIKHLENQIELWKRGIKEEKRRQEEMMLLQAQITKWCKRKAQIHKGVHKWSKHKTAHRKQNHKRKGMGKSKSRIITNNRDSIRLATWNIRGIQEKAKMQLLVHIMKDKKIDVLLLQETWVNTNSEEVIEGYHFISSSGVENADREARLKKQQQTRGGRGRGR